jgi:hypothetical protein
VPFKVNQHVTASARCLMANCQKFRQLMNGDKPVRFQRMSGGGVESS